MRLKAKLTQDSRISTLPSTQQRALNLNVVIPEEATYTTIRRPADKINDGNGMWIKYQNQTVYSQRAMFVNIAQYLTSENEVELVHVLKKGSEILIEGQVYPSAFVADGEGDRLAKDAKLGASLNMRIKGFEPLDPGTQARYQAYLNGTLTNPPSAPQTPSVDEECA